MVTIDESKNSGPKTFVLLVGDTREEVKEKAEKMLLEHEKDDPYGGTWFGLREDGKWTTRIEWWND
jgi:hypothetical protein